MARKLSTAQVTALTSIRENGHAGPAKSNTVTSLETAKLFRIVPSRTGGFDKFVLTRNGNVALDAAIAKSAPVAEVKAEAAPAAPVAPANPLADKTPLEIDTRAADLDAALYKLDALHGIHLRDIHLAVGDRVTRHGGRKGWSMSDEDAVAAAQVKAARTDLKPWDNDPTTSLTALAGIEAEMIANRAESDLIEAEYARRPWTRFVGVAGGHIHSGIWCMGGTIRPTTIRTWAPALSGLEIADAVAKLGPTLCTHCFPSAPVEWTQGVAKVDDSCSGSGRSEVQGTYRRGTPGWGTCQECRTGQSMTPRGYIRKHKTPK
jgi:hypothetical protein